MRESDVTLCTVSYTHTPLLKVNWDFVARLNSNLRYEWMVVENSPSTYAERLTSGQGPFTVIPGLEKRGGKFAACYHAAGAFMRGLESVTTRFVVFIDPDFFIVREQWITLMRDHMLERGLVFFGAPIHPMLYHKWRYFPCTQLMMVDLEQAGRPLDLLPRYEQKYNLGRLDSAPAKTAAPGRLATLKHHLRLMLKRGAIIDSSLDTAWQLSQNYKDRPWLYECVQPVMKLDRHPLKPRWLSSRWNRALERFLPDKWCYIPKQKNYFTQKGFADRGAFDAAGQGWDETIFQGQPFSFHLRGALASGVVRDHSEELPILRAALATFP